MKKMLFLSAVIISMPLLAEEDIGGGDISGSTSVTVNGGTIHFLSAVVNAACGVDANSINQTIQLGQFRLGDFNKKGDETSHIPFSIKLHSCDPEVASTASITFTGNSDGDNFLLQGAGAAKNIALKITDSKNNPVIPYKPSTEINLIDGQNELNYSASLVSTSDEVSAGSANVVTNFLVTYS
ncbi:TPA: hypothetical protein RUX44_000726 [Aeromonas hydrophila]|uniref:fimbrial protein n=1 Tax=Aeromonas hydrophila TaxID=644 RepID=UPI0028DACA84|nr:hypothetical protein [Aeromonas hydrophila]